MKGMFGGKSGQMPAELGGMDQQALEAAAKQMGQMPGGMPKGLPQSLGGGMALPPGLSGFGKKK